MSHQFRFQIPQQGRSEGSGKMSSLKTKSHTSTHSRILKVVILRSLAGGENCSHPPSYFCEDIPQRPQVLRHIPLQGY